ncbi:MAG: type IV secretory system conjugative DNA transfer family protein, partial [Nanoarchaeota archaeon]|nr:type IV secretory system conjugative DNA transfer family protein [Nanoarchaeota archaeon]
TFFVIIFVNLFTIPLLSEWARQFETVYHYKIMNAISVNAVLQLLQLKSYKNFIYCRDAANYLGWILYFAIGIQILKHFIFSIKKDKDYGDVSEYGSHGTARFQTDEEVKAEYTKDAIGWFLGSTKKRKFRLKSKKKFNFMAMFSRPNYCYHKLNGELNMQTTVIGPPGSIKTTGFVLPNIFHLVNSYKEKNELIERTTNRYNNSVGFKRKWLDFNIEVQKKVDNSDLLENSKLFNWWFGKLHLNYINAKVEMPDLVITDPKSELCSLTYNFLIESGYKVSILDFIYMLYGDSYNPLEFIDSEKELMEVADGYVFSIDAATGGDSDGFWSIQEGQALAALMGAVKQSRPLDRQVVVEVLVLLTDELVNKMDGSIDMIKARQYFLKNVTGAPLQLWKNFLMLSKSDTVAGNILGGLTGKLKLFAIKPIQDLTASSSFNPRELGAKKEQPVALFVFMSDSDRTFSPIINMTLSTIFKTLYNTAREYQNKLYNPVYFLIDEMANIGQIAGMKEMLGTMRGRRIYPMMIWQSLAQMKERYGEAWEDIMSMCDTHIYLGVNDDFTAEYVSKSLGSKTIWTQGLNRSDTEALSESKQYGERKLLMPFEVRKFSNAKLIIVQRARNPLSIFKVAYKYWKPSQEVCKFKDIKDMPLIKKNEVYVEVNENIIMAEVDDESREKHLEHVHHEDHEAHEEHEQREEIKPIFTIKR